MRFGIVFVAEDKYRTFGNYVVRVPPQVGMWHIGRVKEYIKAPIPIDKVYFPTKEIVFRSVDVTPPFGYVKKCHHFAFSNMVTVEVPPNGLCGFLFLRAVVYYKSCTGMTSELSHVEFEYMLDEEGIIKEWREAGYPLQWSIRTVFDPCRMEIVKETVSAVCENNEDRDYWRGG